MVSSSHWKRNGGLAGLVVLVAALFLYFSRDNSAIPVRLGKVERANLVSNLTTNGKVEPLDPRELRAAAPGLVRAVRVKEGDHVRAGQVLVELGRKEAASEVARAEAAIQGAQAEWENIERGGTAGETHELESQIQKARAEREEAARQLAISERLLKSNAVPRAEVDQGKERFRRAEQDVSYLEQRRARRFAARDREQAQAKLTEARVSLELARDRLAATTVTSPVDGILYSLPVRAGNFVPRGELLAKMGDLKRVRLRVYVDEPELGRLTAGQEVQVTWDAYPGVTWKGQVERLPAEVTLLGTRSVGQVDCTIDNSDQRLLPNVNVNVEIVTRRSSGALTVPKEAVLRDNAASGIEGRYVLVYEGGKVRRLPVKVGIATPTRVEVRGVLEEGQRVALATDRKLSDGMRVKVLEER